MDTEFTLPVERFKGFSDGVFAIAITLLVLKFALPPLPAKPTVQEEANAVLAIWPQYLVYAIGFFTIGIMWLNHSAQFRYIERITHGIAVANLVFLFFVVFVPLPTAVMERFGLTTVAVGVYGLTLCAIVISYLLLHFQVLAAHPSARVRWPIINIIMIVMYPVLTVVAILSPIGALVGFAVLAIAAMLPHTVRLSAAAGRSAAETEGRLETKR